MSSPSNRNDLDSTALRRWRGFETEAEFRPEVDFSKKPADSRSHSDMTPMVDVTFLLLIFFMITASFTLQRAIQLPRQPAEMPSRIADESPDAPSIEIIVDQFNAYQLKAEGDDPIEAPSDQEMRVQLRQLVAEVGPEKVIVTAHGNASYEKVVTAFDAARYNRLSNIRVRLTELDF